ncbi:MAG TPA: DUF1592 domain-containing protein [Pirellulales bacterium]|jgi:hypothetical protein|nr:DUF1592 domain-containing protein [Pirellulales bacterium]
MFRHFSFTALTRAFVVAVRLPGRCGHGAIARAVAASALFALAAGTGLNAAEGDRAASFRNDVNPILAQFCHECHGEGTATADVSFDDFKSDEELLGARERWWKAFKQLRAGLMPPRDHERPSAEETRRILDWIKTAVFEIDPRDPDPGQVTIRRLNRAEYRNTIRDLLGVEFDAQAEFPPDEGAHGFDNLGDAQTMSPLLLEKYIAAAKSIVARAVPTVAGVAPEKAIDGASFRPIARRGDDEGAAGAGPDAAAPNGAGSQSTQGKGDVTLSFYQPASVVAQVAAEHAAAYQLVVHLSANEKYVDGVFDYNKCRLTFQVDGQVLLEREFSRQEGKSFDFDFDQAWEAGEHELKFDLTPLTPDEKQTRSLSLRIKSVTVRGPMGKEHWVRPQNYERFFARDVPDDPAGRRQYASEILRGFATRAFRRPVDAQTVERLAALAESIDGREGQTFEAGVAGAMTAVLASPRFLFREEAVEADPPARYALVDEHSLASRLSYFLWSTMPDEELFRRAAERKLRENLADQVKRMLADPRSGQFVRNFVGQWLQARDIDSVNINAFAILSREEKPDPEAERRRARFRELRGKPADSLTEAEKSELEEARKSFFSSRGRFRRFELDGELRRAMRQETEMLFAHVVEQDRSLLELIDCDYTFLNERLAKHYAIDGVEGSEMRRVSLPADSPRGGVLTQGTVLAVTSNPDRTSPVKRGLFILDNLLGMPPPPPPPNIPPLEEATKQISGRTPSLREALELHRTRPLCSSCHDRMDPLGLGLENFNALGLYRESRPDRPIDAAGQLMTGESFADVRALKRILANERRADFYRCVTEKLLTYALGRGLDYHDAHTVDMIAERVEQAGGRFSALLLGTIESAPFQKSRATEVAESRAE